MKEYKFNVEEVTNHLILWIRNWFEKNGKGCKAVLGMSGGKDSTITAALLARALGSNNVVGVMMPDLGQGLNEADEICKHLGINCIYAPIDNITGAFYDSDITKDNGIWSLNNFSKQAEQNIPPRVRMTMLYALSPEYRENGYTKLQMMDFQIVNPMKKSLDLLMLNWMIIFVQIILKQKMVIGLKLNL